MSDVAPPILVEVIRDGRVESAHRGSLICLDELGIESLVMGDVDSQIFPRSALKPAQAVAMLHAGADLSGALLAVAAGSHSGSREHVQVIEDALLSHGLGRESLQCPADAPYGVPERNLWSASGAKREPILMNCSGKHTAMLITSAINGWSVDDYLNPDHPLQLLIKSTIEGLCEEQVVMTTVDGCGAPLHMVSLRGLAKLAHKLAIASADTPEGRVAQAMRDFPEFVAGENRDTTVLMRSVSGLLLKEGAEGVQIGALKDGKAFAFKIEDGSMRARPPIIGGILGFFGLNDLASPEVTAIVRPAILGGGKPKGFMQCVRLAT